MKDTTRYITTSQVAIKWPFLDKPNQRFKRFTAAFELPAHSDEADALVAAMQQTLDDYLENSSISDSYSRAEFYAVAGDTWTFNIQNKQAPDLLDTHGDLYTGPPPAGGSLVRLVLEPIAYTNGSTHQIGVSLRMIAVEIVKALSNDLNRRNMARELLGHEKRDLILANDDFDNFDEFGSDFDAGFE